MNPEFPVKNVAIIGAGLSGLALALALHKQSIPCTVYESRSASLNIGGAVMLSPNALKVLDALGIYERIRTKGYNFEILELKDPAGNLLETYEFGGQTKYGYQGLRIYRHVLIDELLLMLEEKKIPVKYGMKFTRIVSETEKDVTWEFADGSTHSASILVGADGIHSTVRKYLYPNLEKKFTGMAGITAAVPTAQVLRPAGYHLPVTIVAPEGAFVIAPQESDGSEVLIGKQKRIEDQGREGWDRMLADKAPLVEFLQKDTEVFGDIAKSAVSHIPHDKINVWPFFIIPKLDEWTSKNRRVVILGDAAHAIPPSAGQGINQAFEDIYMCALLLSESGKVNMEEALRFWQDYRQQRINKIMELNAQIDLRRMPKGDSITSHISREPFELSWLYEPDFEKDVREWVQEVRGRA